MEQTGPIVCSRESLVAFVRAAGVADAEGVEPFMFGDSRELARELAAEVAQGSKRATTSLLAAWEAEGSAPPAVGQRYVVHDWDGTPWALIENTHVEVRPYCEVDAEYAYVEGEGERTLESWRRDHASYFARECERLGRTFDEGMLVVCQRFMRLYPPG